MVANTRRNKDIRKAVDNLIRVVHNTANSEGETLIVGNNSISTSNSSNSISSVTERIRHMIQASSRNFNRLRSNEKLGASCKLTSLHEL